MALSLEGRIMLFKRSDTSKNSTTTSTSADSAGSTGCASASSGCASASTSGASSASSEHCHQKAKGKKQQSKTSKDKSCNSSALAKDRLSALIKNDLQDERGPESVAERLKAVLKDSPRARAEQEAKLMEPSVQSDGADTEACAEACAEASDSDEPKFYAPVVVYTVEELAQAQKDRAERIVVKGELAEKLKVALKGLRSIGAGSLNTLALCLSGAALLAPFTGGVSLGAAGTAMGTLGAALTATAIAAISAMGLALVIAVFKGYDEVKLGGGGVELVIKKHKDKKQAKRQNLLACCEN